VFNMSRDGKPDWGGYFNIPGDRGDVRAGFAPVGRYAITGWVRDR
jgi:hypothetical protein